jgi:hypothetical protein
VSPGPAGRSPFSFSVWILGGGALLLGIFLLVGYLLPGTWEADASQVIASTPEELMPYLDSPEGWQEWTPWPENGVERIGPERGAGARLSWDDLDLGSGSFTIESVAPTRIEYTVDVEEGSMVSKGTVTMTPAEDAVRVDWHEEGDFGWNPLMGYWALRMGSAQSQELAKGLARLDSLVSGSAPSR